MTAGTAVSLADTQRRRILALHDEYRASGLSTAPADRITTERIITGFYARIGRPAPLFQWFDGPLSCILAYNIIEQFDEEARLRGGPIDHQIKHQLRTPLRRGLAGETRSQLGDEVCGKLGTKEWSWLEDDRQDNEGVDGNDLEIDENAAVTSQGLVLIPKEPRSAFDSRLGGEVEGEIRRQLNGRLQGVPYVRLWRALCDRLALPALSPPDCRRLTNPRPLWGGEAQSWVSHHVACAAAGARFESDARELLAEWDELNRACGWWFPFEHTVLCAERYSQICFDPSRRLHGENGPAVECRDGLKLYRWHGIDVPSEWIEQRETLDPSTVLTWRNIEQRRAAVEIIGWARILSCIATRTVDEDADPLIGTLLECDLPGAGLSRFLRVRCSTGREFVLSVPLEMRMAREANAWTYGLDEDEYRLEART